MKLAGWMVVSGVVLAVVGLVMYVHAGSKRHYAEMVGQFQTALGDPSKDPAGVAHWVTLQHWGVGLLAFGGLVAVLGVTVLAVRRK